jgi:peptide/nickel transport system permease protein
MLKNSGTKNHPVSEDGYNEIQQALLRFKQNKAALVGSILLLFLVLVALTPSVLPSLDPYSINLLKASQPPNREYILGTDALGRDVLSRMVYSVRVSLAVGFLSVAIGLFAGIMLGLITGFYGGVGDRLIMRILDVIWAFPAFLIAITLMAVIGPGLLNVILVLGLVGLPRYTRLTRSFVLSIVNRDYVLVARSIGVSSLKIMVRHILPNIIGPIIVFATLGVGTAILQEAGLSFLGVGVARPMASFGMMLAEARNLIRFAPLLCIFPGLGITLIVLALNTVGDGLRDAIDPKIKR